MTLGVKRKNYDLKFKNAAVARLGNETAAQIAKDLGCSPGQVRKWARGESLGEYGKGLKGKEGKAANGVATPKKKSYYVPVAARHSDPQDLGRTVSTCISLLKGVRSKCDNSDPIHLTALLVLATLEGKL
jgi:transposase-like protein